MRRVAALLLAVAAVAALAVAALAPSPVAAHNGVDHGAPVLTLLTPPPVAGDYTMQLRVDNFHLSTDFADADADSGHFLYALNQDKQLKWIPCIGTCSGGDLAETANAIFTFHDVKAGDQIAAILLHGNGTPVDPPVLVVLTVVNGNQADSGPQVYINGTSPNPATPNPGDYTMHVVVDRLDLVRPGSGEANDRDSGHLRYLFNGRPCDGDCAQGQAAETDETSFTFHGVAVGDLVAVELLNNDGSAFSPAVGQRLVVAAPALQLLSQAPHAPSGDFVVRAASFTLVPHSDPAPANNAGAGHIHYLVKHKGDAGFQNAPGTYFTASTRFHFTGLEDGDIIAAELVNNDHSPLSPPVMVTQQVLARENQDPLAPGVGPILAVALLGAALVARRLRE